ncbi:hypothetical protein ABW20_dc0105174 [Dactylellina cionopaga]|nr:hypothetical protein ABW20_dc0105174 [Dactylellina cionopaga]
MQDTATDSDPDSEWDFFELSTPLYEVALAALKGLAIPRAKFLNRGYYYSLIRACVIRGIRLHAGFGTELYGQSSDFDRAINARKIMSNEIPTIDNEDAMPYCIWYPETATEQTYRTLAKEYPQLKYNIGRACAVAGYLDLYLELNLLPEVNIAEEARDNEKLEIYNLIMNAPKKFKVMDDYNRCINLDNPVEANLNCDTAIRSYIDFRNIFTQSEFHFTPTFDIEEDNKLDGYQKIVDRDFTREPKYPIDVTPYLYTPLPQDLPQLNKNLLIASAAYYGDFERYARLRRPKLTWGETTCAVRGIYHNTMFAKWYSLQMVPFERNVTNSFERIMRAINARFIMNNDLSRITDDLDDRYLPYLIWYPARPYEQTLQELVRRKPSMRQAAARACIVANFTNTYDMLNPEADQYLISEAKACENPYFLQDLERRAKEQGMNNTKTLYHEARLLPIKEAYESNSLGLNPNLAGQDSMTNPDYGWKYDGFAVDFGIINLAVCAPDDLKARGPMSLGNFYYKMGLDGK